MFAHTANPVLCMCLLYELLLEIIKIFYSLNNMCRNLMSQCMTMALQYIEEVDDENFLTHVVTEKDYQGRDLMKIAV